MSYNGWTNYETWDITLHIDNDRSSYQYWHEEVVAECMEDAEDELHLKRAVADALEAYLEDLWYESSDNIPMILQDICHAALREVNTWEIAEYLIGNQWEEELKRRAEEEEEED